MRHQRPEEGDTRAHDMDEGVPWDGGLLGL